MGHVEAGRAPSSWCLPLAPPATGALGSLRVIPFLTPLWGYRWRVAAASALGCVRCGGLVCVDPVTDASGFPYHLSFDGGVGRCTRAVWCERGHLPLRVGGRHTQVPCVYVSARVLWPGRADRHPGGVLVCLSVALAVLVSFGVFPAPSVLGLPCLFLFSFFFVCPRCLRLFMVSGLGCPRPWRRGGLFFFIVCPSPSACSCSPLFTFMSLATPVALPLCALAPGAPGCRALLGRFFDVPPSPRFFFFSSCAPFCSAFLCFALA